MNKIFLTFVCMYIYYINICLSTTPCGCTIFGDAVDCSGGTSLSGTACLWYPDTHELFIDGIHCRATEWADCLIPGANCPPPGNPAPAQPSSSSSVPGAGTIPDGCLPATTSSSSGSVNFIPVKAVSTSPDSSIATAIDEANNPDGDCATNSNDCWIDSGKSNHDYSTHSIIYEGVSYDSIKGCCYKYKSSFTGNNDCNGKSPTQSHLVFEMDCDNSYWSLNSANAGYISNGVDGSTCYEGIKLDVGCSGSCDYEICINYDSGIVSNGECYVKNGWVMNKAGPTFAFNALNGIPTCASPTASIFSLQYWTQSTNYLNDTYVKIILVFIVFAALYYYYYIFGKNKDAEYQPLQESYSTFQYQC